MIFRSSNPAACQSHLWGSHPSNPGCPFRLMERECRGSSGHVSGFRNLTAGWATVRTEERCRSRGTTHFRRKLVLPLRHALNLLCVHVLGGDWPQRRWILRGRSAPKLETVFLCCRMHARGVCTCASREAGKAVTSAECLRVHYTQQVLSPQERTERKNRRPVRVLFPQNKRAWLVLFLTGSGYKWAPLFPS